jgi:hypothetical protein
VPIAVLLHESVEFAYQLGCNAIRLAGIAEHLTPMLKKKSVTNEQASLQSSTAPKVNSVTLLRLI